MATARGDTGCTDGRGSISEREALSFLQPEKPTERILLDHHPGRRRAPGPLARPPRPRTQRGHPHAAGLAQPAPLSQASAPRRGPRTPGADLHGNTGGPSTTGTERVSGTEGEKRGPSPAPSFQKQVRNYKLEIETSNAGHGNQKLYMENFPGGPAVKNLPADSGDVGLIPGSGGDPCPPPWGNQA